MGRNMRHDTRKNSGRIIDTTKAVFITLRERRAAQKLRDELTGEAGKKGRASVSLPSVKFLQKPNVM